MPAAPSSDRAERWNAANRSGLRLVASSSARARLAARTSARQSILETNLEEVMSSSAASPLCPLFTYAVETAMRWGKDSATPSLAARSAASSLKVSATRDGPRRFTSTAPSKGASKVTDAAAWITMSHDPSNARPASSSASPSRPTSPAIV